MKKLILLTALMIGSLSAKAGGTAAFHAAPSHNHVGSGGSPAFHSAPSTHGGSYSYHQSGYHGGYHHDDYHHHDGGSHTSFAFSFGYPFYSYGGYYPTYSYGYPVYGAPYVSSYNYGYSDPGYSYRPNYAVTGTLLGALTGGLIGDSVHHQGWEGAGIGAAAGLLLGGLAEHGARTQERAAYSAPRVSYVQPNTIPDAPRVNDAPVAPAAPSYQPSSASGGSMSSANSLFGR